MCSHCLFFMAGLYNLKNSKGQVDQHKFAVGHKILFYLLCHSLEQVLK